MRKKYDDFYHKLNRLLSARSYAKKKGDTKRVEELNRKIKKMCEIREPDIAFWFDEKEPNTYLVKVSGELRHIQLIQACFDLLARAIREDEDTVIGEIEFNEEK